MHVWRIKEKKNINGQVARAFLLKCAFNEAERFVSDVIVFDAIIWKKKHVNK